jgi:hypothetical protein
VLLMFAARLLVLLRKYVVCDGIPGIVNADEEKKQRRPGDAEKGFVRTGAGGICRDRQGNVCGNREHDMKEPVLELRPVAVCLRIRQATIEAYTIPPSPTRAQMFVGAPSAFHGALRAAESPSTVAK